RCKELNTKMLRLSPYPEFNSGLACLAQNSNAIKKVYDIKGRNGQKPLAILCIDGVHIIVLVVLNTDLNPFTPLVGVTNITVVVDGGPIGDESVGVNSGRPIGVRQIPHHQTWLVNSDTGLISRLQATDCNTFLSS
uniref:Threonylcarbamoyl-AMP synthase n=1 Tax=Salmo trutta TaxID=8032 RepID=A0A673X3Y8_SALTR